jgi:uncharacterized protein (DUF2267 family)
MSHSNVTQMSHACHQAQEWLKELASHPPFEVEEQAYSYLRAVLHTLRDRLTLEEAVHLAAHLPTLIRGVYFEGWKPSKNPDKIKSANEFYRRVEESFGGLASGSSVDTVAGTNAVIAFLEAMIDPGEMRHVKAQLPQGLQDLFNAEAA